MVKNLYLILEKPTEHNYGKLVNLLIFSLVGISIISFFLSTVDELKVYQNYFDMVEYVVLITFTIEFILRLISIGESPEYKGFIGRIKYLFTPFIIIDILVLLPFYLSFFGIDLLFLRILRLLRIFKLFRHTKYDEFDDTLILIFKENKSKFVVILAMSAILVLFTAPIIYYLENNAQPEVFSSIPAALWWTTVTFTTVGYGDMYPVTALGKILATVVSVLGIAFYTIPGAIFTSALLDKLSREKETK